MGSRNEAGRRVAGWIARTAIGAALAGTALGWTGAWWWAGEVAASLRPVFAAVLGLGALIAWLHQRTGWALVCGLLSLTFPLLALPLELEQAPAGAAGATRDRIRVFCHNVHGGENRQAPAVLEAIRSLSPDIVVLLEIDSWWAARVQELDAAYPYHQVEARSGFFGIGLFSRLPLRESAIKDFSGYGLPSVVARFDLSGRTATLIGTHPPPPVDSLSFRIRNWQFSELAREARLRPGPLIVAGDLNCTPWSAHFRRFLREAGLRQSGVSREITWSPWRCRWLGFPIDYQLASADWQQVSWRTGDFLGSDHRWTFAEFQLAGRR